MGYNKITNLLGKLDKDEIPKFTTIKWIEIFDQSNGTYNPNKVIRFQTPQIRSFLCDFNETYIAVTGKVNAANANPPAGVDYSKKLALKNSAPFFNCILKINNQLIEDAQDLDIVITMYNLLNYSKNFRKTTGSFWNYYPDKPNSGYREQPAGQADNIYERTKVFYPFNNSESFDYKTKLVGNLPKLQDKKLPVSLKNLSSFIFNFNFLRINSEIELILKWSQNCVLTEKATREEKAQIPAQGGNAGLPFVPAINRPTDLKFNITDCKMYVLN